MAVPATIPTPAIKVVTEAQVEDAVSVYLTEARALFSAFTNIPPGFFSQENFAFNSFGQEPFLLISKFKLHELPLQIQRRLPIYLTEQFKIQVEFDSQWFWALTKDVSPSSSVLRSWSLFPAFETIFAAHLSSRYSSDSELGQKLNKIIDEALPQASSDLLKAAPDAILMYLVYPVLEGILKRVLRTYVDDNGKIISPFAVGTNNYRVNSRISDLSVYLYVLEANAGTLVAKPGLQNDLRDFRRVIETDFATPIATLAASRPNPTNGWDWVYSLRNVSLHGAIGSQLRSGLITNLICMLTWHILEPSEVSEAVASISSRIASSFRIPYNRPYYPPDEPESISSKIRGP